MIITLLFLLLACNIHASDATHQNVLSLSLLTQEHTTTLFVNHNNNRLQTIINQINQKKEDIDDQCQECLCQAATVWAAGMIFGTIFYPSTLHISVPSSLCLGTASSVPYCGVLSCIHCYDYTKKQKELHNLIQQYPQTEPTSREMGE